MKSEVLTVKKINKKTKAEMFKNIKVGNKILLSIPVESVGRGYRGTYASYIRIDNLDTDEHTFKSFNEICYILPCFEFE
jgi:hypothetical protein